MNNNIINIEDVKENWLRWNPIPGLAKKYYLTELLHNITAGFIIEMLNEDNQKVGVKIVFAEAVLAYRYTEESLPQFTVHYLRAKYEEEFYSAWCLFKIENSTYLKWITEESYGIYDDIKLTHFCILTSDQRLDIIVGYEPEVTLFTAK